MGWKSHFFVKIEFINTICQQRIEKRYQFLECILYVLPIIDCNFNTASSFTFSPLMP